MKRSELKNLFKRVLDFLDLETFHDHPCNFKSFSLRLKGSDSSRCFVYKADRTYEASQPNFVRFMTDLVDGSILSFSTLHMSAFHIGKKAIFTCENPFKDLGSLEALAIFLDLNEDDISRD